MMETCLSVVMPVYNEAQTVRKMAELVLQRPCVKELVIADDGSADGTRDVLKRLAETEPCVRILLHERNQGKGAALRTGFAAAQGPYVIVQDADLEYDPAEYPRLLAPVLQDRPMSCMARASPDPQHTASSISGIRQATASLRCCPICSVTST